MEDKSKRYQVFVSSTFVDLALERAAAINAILAMNHMPTGMELFPAAPEAPWELIKRIIDLSDYYIVIVGGKYGSTNAEGLSFTEREYDYAHDEKKGVIPFLHENIGQLPADRVDLDQEKRERRGLFVKKLESRHTVKYWHSAEELAGKVVLAITHAITEWPAVGWVRADGIDSTEILKKNSDLHEENARLRQQVEQLRAMRSSEPTSERALADIADSLGAKGAVWFLGMSDDVDCQTPLGTLQGENMDRAVSLLQLDVLVEHGNEKHLRLSQLGWDLRDEMLRRRMLVTMLDGPMEVDLLRALWASEEESDKTLRGLTSRGYVVHADSDEGSPPQFTLSPTGKVAASRLYS